MTSTTSVLFRSAETCESRRAGRGSSRTPDPEPCAHARPPLPCPCPRGTSCTASWHPREQMRQVRRVGLMARCALCAYCHRTVHKRLLHELGVVTPHAQVAVGVALQLCLVLRAVRVMTLGALALDHRLVQVFLGRELVALQAQLVLGHGV